MSTRLARALAIALLALAADGAVAHADGAPVPPINDHPYLSNYQCYGTSGGRQPVDDDRRISDQFGSRIVDLDEPDAFCAGAQLHTETEFDPLEGNDGADFTCYDVDGGRRPGVELLVSNQFTDDTPAALTVEHAKTLCVPTPRGTTSETDVGDWAAGALDEDDGFNLYYQCYSVEGGRQPQDDVRFVRDWLGPELQSGDDLGRRVDVDQPERLCAPANRDGANRVDVSGTHYVCYDIDGGQTVDYDHFFFNRLSLPGLDQMRLDRAESVCVPSTWRRSGGS